MLGVLGEVCWRLIGSEAGTFVEFRDSLVMAGALAGLDFGVRAVRVGDGRSWVGTSVSGSVSGNCIPGFVVGFGLWIFR